MIIEIEALDTLFFRDGKPFEMGDDTFASGVFPPAPSVFYGALRSMLLSENQQWMIDLEKAKKDKADLPENHLLNSLVINRIDIISKSTNLAYFPIPLDLVQFKEKNESQLFFENRDKKYLTIPLDFPKEPVNNISFYASSPIDRLFSSVEIVDEVEDGIIDKDDLANYLLGQKTDIYALKVTDSALSEAKIGIERNNETHISTDGKLYRVNLKRLKDIKYSVDFSFSDNSIASSGFLKLGGEGKIIRYQERNDTYLSTFDTPVIIANICKIYLESPSVFSNGWLPSWIDKETLKGTLKGIELELFSAITGKPESIGGFDMLKTEPKIMRKAVPAGSVYIYKTTNNQEINFSELFNQKSICDNYPEKYENQGFGHFYLAKA